MLVTATIRIQKSESLATRIIIRRVINQIKLIPHQLQSLMTPNVLFIQMLDIPGVNAFKILEITETPRKVEAEVEDEEMEDVEMVNARVLEVVPIILEEEGAMVTIPIHITKVISIKIKINIQIKQMKTIMAIPMKTTIMKLMYMMKSQGEHPTIGEAQIMPATHQ